MYTKPLLILSLLAAIMLLATSYSGSGGRNDDGGSADNRINASVELKQHGREKRENTQPAIFMVTLSRENDTGSPITFEVSLQGTATSSDYNTPSPMEISVADGPRLQPLQLKFIMIMKSKELRQLI